MSTFWREGSVLIQKAATVMENQRNLERQITDAAPPLFILDAEVTHQ